MKKPWPSPAKVPIVFRGPAGYGDSIYNIAIVNELLKIFPKIKIRTRHPSLFTWIPGMEVEAWRKHGEDIAIHYSHGKRSLATNQWQDLCQSARIDISLPFKISWKVHNMNLLNQIKEKAQGKKICVVACPYTPFNRDDGYGLELRPKWNIFDELVRHFKKEVFFVLIGTKIKEYNLLGCDMNMVGKTSDTDVMDLGEIADFAIAQNGYVIPMMESRDKPIFIIYSKKGLMSGDPYIANTSPQKIFSKTTSHFCVDDENIPVILKRARMAFKL